MGAIALVLMECDKVLTLVSENVVGAAAHRRNNELLNVSDDAFTTCAISVSRPAQIQNTGYPTASQHYNLSFEAMCMPETPQDARATRLAC